VDRIGVEQHWAGGQGRLLVQDRLVLETVVLEEEVPPAFAERRAEALVVPQLGQPLPERGAFRDPLEEGERDLVLGFDPGLGVRGVNVLQPAVRIGNALAVYRLPEAQPWCVVAEPEPSRRASRRAA
jgi:hypothetical protein